MTTDANRGLPEGKVRACPECDGAVLYRRVALDRPTNWICLECDAEFDFAVVRYKRNGGGTHDLKLRLLKANRDDV